LVHADETSWSIHSVQALLSERAHVLVFGCRKDAATLQTLLPKALFEGVLVSDDAAVDQGFSQAQKCWAHLTRKAIRLMLLGPTSRTYRRLLDGLLDLYRTACGFAQDQRLGANGRRHKVDVLSDQLCDLLGPHVASRRTPTTDAEKDFANLVERQRLLGDDELFTFVLHPQAIGTKNEVERTLRQPALDRRTGCAGRTLVGARRRTIVVSVLESLRLHLEHFTLPHVLQEIGSWLERGTSRFQQPLTTVDLPPPASSPLHHLLPAAKAACPTRRSGRLPVNGQMRVARVSSRLKVVAGSEIFLHRGVRLLPVAEGRPFSPNLLAPRPIGLWNKREIGVRCLGFDFALGRSRSHRRALIECRDRVPARGRNQEMPAKQAPER